MRRPVIALLFTAALGVSACAYYDDYGYGQGYGYNGHRYGDYRYDGREYAGWSRESRDHFTGNGAALLDPWLVQTKEGRTVVAAGPDQGRPRLVSADTAHRANAWFRRYADRDRNLQLTDPEIRAALVQVGSRRS